VSDELMELPEGWAQATFGDICKVQGGYAFKSQDYQEHGVLLIRISNLVDEQVQLTSNSVFLPKHYWEKFLEFQLKEGDVLIAMSGATTGKMATYKLDSPALLNQRVGRFKIKDLTATTPSYVAKLVESITEQVLQQAYGGAQPNISPKEIEEFPVPLPPLNEQKRIVAAIESLRERSQKARSALSAIPELCDKFRQSVLAAAFRGDLTADWREQNPDVEPASVVLERIRLERRLKWQEKELRRMKFQGKTPKDDKWKQKYKEPDKIEELADIELPDLPDGWVWLSADECTSWITDGEHATPERSEEGIYLLSARNVLNGRVSLDKVDFVSEQVHRKLEERLKIEPGDVFLSCSGTVGRSCVVPPDVQCSLVRSVAVLKPLFEMGEYLSLSIRSPYVQSQIEQKKTQTAQSNIFQGRIKTLAIPIAPLNEQKVIIEQITEAFRFIQSVEQIIQLLDDRGEHLDRSILAKAFRGELVEQDPNDEPAAVLLERIRVDREQQMRGKIKKPGKKKRTGD